MGILLLSASLYAEAMPAAGTPEVFDSLTVEATAIDVDLYGNIYLLDGERGVLTILDPAGKFVGTMGGAGWENSQFDRPAGLWARNGIDVFVADYGNHRIQRFDRSLSYVSTLFTREDDTPEKRFGYPTDVTLSRLGDLFVCDGENQRLIQVNRDGDVVRSIGDFSAGKGRLTAPCRVDIGAQDRLYVLDGRRIVVFDIFGNYVREVGLPDDPLLLWADDDGLLVADKGTLYVFDRDERPVVTIPIQVLCSGRNLKAIAAGSGRMFLLAGESLIVRSDPRRTGDNKNE